MDSIEIIIKVNEYEKIIRPFKDENIIQFTSRSTEEIQTEFLN